MGFVNKKWFSDVCLFALHYVVAASQNQVVSMKFAQCLRKCFCLYESSNANINLTTIIKQNQGKVRNLRK